MSVNRQIRAPFAACIAVAIVLLAGCASTVQGPAGSSDEARPAQQTHQSPMAARVPHSKSGALPRNQVPRFSAARPGSDTPAGWEPWIVHPRKRLTRYEVTVVDGLAVLQARASSSASGLMTNLDVDPASKPVLAWRWRAESLVEGADNTDGTLEDAPVRIVLAFEGDKTQLPMRDQMFFERVKLLSGRELPYAMLMYIWENHKPVGSVLTNPHTSRIRKVVVESGPAGLKRWHVHRRNIVDDYRKAFGKDPGRLIGVAVMTDTDNTGTDVAAQYGDIELSER